MKKDIESIVEDVRVAIDANMRPEGLLAVRDTETLSVDEIIRSKIVDAIKTVECSAPVHMLEEGHTFGKDIFWESGDCGWILLPDNFMRLLSFRMSDWERTCYSAISADDPIYAQQSSRYKGIKGNPQKPVCAVVSRPEGKALEFYSCSDSQATVARATYIPYPEIDEYKRVDLSAKCYRAIVYQAAALTFMALGVADKAAIMVEFANKLLEI